MSKPNNTGWAKAAQDSLAAIIDRMAAVTVRMDVVRIRNARGGK